MGSNAAGRRRSGDRFVGGLDAVTAVALGAIERGIGAGDQRIDLGRRRSARDTDAYRCRGVSARQYACRLEGPPHAFGGDACLGQGAWQQRDEFLAAQPADDVAGAQGLFHDRCKQMERRIAGMVAMRVIDRLEVIEVERQHADRLLGQPAVTHHFGASLKEAASIEQFRQRIGCGRQFVLPHGAILRQDEHDESCADNVKHDFDRIDGDPTGAETEHAAVGLR